MIENKFRRTCKNVTISPTGEIHTIVIDSGESTEEFKERSKEVSFDVENAQPICSRAYGISSTGKK